MNPVKKVYVVVPSTEDASSILEYLIEPAISESGMEAVRSDDRFPTNLQNLATSELVVADLTGMTTAVSYEVGVAHALEKPTILISQSYDDVPKFLKGYHIIIYSTRFDKAVELINDLKSYLVKYSDNKIIGNPVADYIIQDSRKFNISDKILPQNKELQPMTLVIQNNNFKFEGLEKLHSSVTRITAYSMQFTEKLEQRTREMNAMAHNPGSGSYAKVQRIVRNSAENMNTYARQIKSERQTIEEGSNFIIESIDYFSAYTKNISDGDSETFKFKLSIREIDSTMEESLTALFNLKDSLDPGRNLDKILERAIINVQSELDFLIDNFINIRFSCDRAQLLISTREDKGM